MQDLIAALTIFAKYCKPQDNLTSCEHDMLYVCIDPGGVSDGDRVALETLGFKADHELGSFRSYRFGSC